MAKDYYDTLGVDRSATDSEIKSAYRKLAMKYHPDRNPDDAQAEQRFKELAEAWDVLKDADKRSAYDRMGHAAFEQAASGGGGSGFGSGFGGFGNSSGSGFDFFDDVFNDLMGGGRGQKRAQRGSDLRYNMEIGLEEAFSGTRKTIRVPTHTPCDDCNGNGSADSSGPVTCSICHGQGKIRQSQGFFAIERTCPNCQGNGKVIKNPCRGCSGTGLTEKASSLEVEIPAGVDEGSRIRLTGKGEFGPNGTPPGDLYIFISVRPHNFFQRDGSDLVCRVPIPMITAALGGTVETPTIDGKRLRIDIKPGTQNGHQLRLRCKGMSVLRRSSRGDMYIHIVVEVPVNLSTEQRKHLEAFKESCKGCNIHPETEGFFDKLKSFVSKF